MNPQEEAKQLIETFFKFTNDRRMSINLALNQLDFTLNAFDLIAKDVSYEKDYFVEVKRALQQEALIFQLDRIDELSVELQKLTSITDIQWDIKIKSLDVALAEFLQARNRETI